MIHASDYPALTALIATIIDLTDTTTLTRDYTTLFGDLSTFCQIVESVESVESVGPSEMGWGGGGG